MAYQFVDNVYSKSLTPKEPNVELLDASCERNIIVCLANNSGKTFIASKLIQSTINQADKNEGTITLYVADSRSAVTKKASHFQRLTDLIVTEFVNKDLEKMESIRKIPKVDRVVVIETHIAVLLLQKKILLMADINLLVLHDCHNILSNGLVPMKQLMEFYNESHRKPHVLSLASSLFTSGLDLSQIKSSLRKMEDLLDCKAETASNILSLLRYGTHPHEVLIEYGPHEPCAIDQIVESEILNAINFIKDHRYDPLEMYEGFTEELQNIPDPKHDPEEILGKLLHVLHTLGPWSADRAALVLLLQIEKLKVTTPYERHFLLLCMTSSVLVKIRAILDDFFRDVDEKDRIYKYTSPKILRVIEILRKFVPEKVDSNANESSKAVKGDESSEDEEEESEEDLDEDMLAVSRVIRTLRAKTKHSTCHCETMAEFLLARLKFSILSNVTYEKFLELIKTKKLSLRKALLLGNEGDCASPSELTNVENCIDDSDRDKDKETSITDVNQSDSEGIVNNSTVSGEGIVSNSTLPNEGIVSNGTVSDEKSPSDAEGNSKCVFQNKNGYLPVSDTELFKGSKDSTQLKNSKINEVHTIESYLQYHEYLLLPKFKVDRHARYERYSLSNHARHSGGGGGGGGVGGGSGGREAQDDIVLKQMKNFIDGDAPLCGLIFVEKKFTAKVLFHVLNDLKQADEEFSFLSVQFTVGKIIDGTKDPKGAENEHRKQELMLKRFRIRACNLLIGTSFLEEGIDLPKCNLVIRFDVPKSYRSYINTKERARAVDSLYCLLVDANSREEFVTEMGKYYETEAMLLDNCGHLEPSEEDEKEADQYTQLIQPFCPLMKQDCPHVDLSTAVTLVNRYCAKLPSDTFTRLTPMWHISRVYLSGREMFVCNIRLPINSPIKQEIEGCPMPTKVLARRFAALQCCQILHQSGELDDTLQPISKESFWMREEEQLSSSNEELKELFPKDSLEPRPGTTKRRQYYYKRIADSLTDCLPVAGEPAFLYDISMALSCPLPEEQNTRGRKIHPPEDSSQGFGILTRKNIPKIGPFPIFTRSGEVEVKLKLAQSTVVLTELQIHKIVAFIHFTFTSVLRLQKHLMMFDPNSSENSYFIVPTKKGKDSGKIEVDWDFLELIYEKRNKIPTFVSEEVRKNFEFDPSKFEDAVVSPWYRNQDQPQYLYVAEICMNLNPKSAFPGTEYNTFEEYYFKKYDIVIQNGSQALLDVDHTSARLNFLTPRYVNRKGVALPTTSEEKKRAKRENLKQKQILIPELCDIHPFPATLWRKVVCLPCILHRINALLLADQVRRVVATEIGVGGTQLDEDFNWKPLNFGWSLADVLKQTKAAQKQQQDEQEATTNESKKCDKVEEPEVSEKDKNASGAKENATDENGCAKEENGKEKGENWIEIGTWTNDMAHNKPENNDSFEELDEDMDNISLPKNVTMIEKADINGINGWDSEISTAKKDSVRSPTTWLDEPQTAERNLPDCLSDSEYSDDDDDDDDDDDEDDDYFFEESSDSDVNSGCGGLKIEFKEDNVAEAVENNRTATNFLEELNETEEEQPWFYEDSDKYLKYIDEFSDNLSERKKEILKSKKFFSEEKPFDFTRGGSGSKRGPKTPYGNSKDFTGERGRPFGSAVNSFPQVVQAIPKEIKNLPHTNVILEAMNGEKRRQEEKRRDDIKTEPKTLVGKRTTFDELNEICKDFSFDKQPDLNGHPGPSPSLILQALTMSNANDGINLERLETIGDSFLKYAITTYLYCVYENVHEGKLSHLRSKQVSNFNLYRLGRRKALGESMIATKFEPHDNWLPPCYYVPRELERALIEAGIPASHWNRADLPSLKDLTKEEICQLVREKGEKLGIVNPEKGTVNTTIPCLNLENMPCFIPYNLMTQHSIPDKSIADCVEALIGAYLVACGPRGALLFMSWLGIKVLPKEERFFKSDTDPGIRKGVGCSVPVKVTTDEGEVWSQVCFGELQSPKQPLIRHVPDPEGELEKMLRGFDAFEDSIKYRFCDRSYLLQALTHASYSQNRLTDCYQRLEFLGDAVLDYLITRHLYEDSRHHSPGALTDLRSALVNNTIFASLAVRHNFHKYFRHSCPSLNEVVDRFVRFQQENGHSISEEFYLIEEEECEEAEDVEVPKALGDVFESVAGAIFLDSGMALDAVWKVYYRIMKNEIELFSTNVPKSPIRELFELEPETAQFGKPEKLADGRRVRVTVEVFGKGIFNGIGRNYRIAKCTAAKCALKQLKRKGLLERRK